MPVFVCDCYFLYDLFNVLICGFDGTIHLWPVRGRIMVLDLELHVQCGVHIIVDIHTIVSARVSYHGSHVNLGNTLLSGIRYGSCHDY